jgi:hypothetical protein
MEGRLLESFRLLPLAEQGEVVDFAEFKRDRQKERDQ